MRPNKSFKVRMRQMENKTVKIRIPAVLVVIALTITTASAQYKRTDLVSNGPTVAPFTDPHLVNAWGLVALPTSPWWTSDNGTGFSTLYNGAGQQMPLFVAVPPAPGSPAGTLGTPTGIVFASVEYGLLVAATAFACCGLSGALAHVARKSAE